RYRVSLSIEERRYRRKMGARRVAYVQVGERLGEQYEQRMPRDFNSYHLHRVMQSHSGLSRVFSHVSEVNEILDDTLMALGIDAMALAKMVHDTLRTANQLDPSLDGALRELDEFYKRAQAEELEEESQQQNNPTPLA
ncbi:MAG: hypothetical protein ACK4TA_19090, partial [Saprospiraceae bacterium]